MSGPTVAEYLAMREKELERQLSEIRGSHIAPREAELAQVKKMRALLADAVAAGLIDLASNTNLEPPMPATSTDLTIKQMTLCALRDHFTEGASPTELRDYMKSAYAKDIDRNSISPQLTRLREEGMVDMLSSGKWKLSRQGIGIMRYGNYAAPLRKFLAAGEADSHPGAETHQMRLRDLE
jgi:DNA-binding transcriptional ArsR family regulator